MIDRKGNCLRQAFSAICPATCCMRYFAFTLWIVIRVFRVNPRQKPFFGSLVDRGMDDGCGIYVIR